MKDDRVQCCEKLGELIMPSNAGMVLNVYLRAACHSKAINYFIQWGKYDKIVPYASSVGLKMDGASMLSQLLFRNSQGTLDLIKSLVNAEGLGLEDEHHRKININTINKKYKWWQWSL